MTSIQSINPSPMCQTVKSVASITDKIGTLSTALSIGGYLAKVVLLGAERQRGIVDRLAATGITYNIAKVLVGDKVRDIYNSICAQSDPAHQFNAYTSKLIHEDLIKTMKAVKNSQEQKFVTVLGNLEKNSLPILDENQTPTLDVLNQIVRIYYPNEPQYTSLDEFTVVFKELKDRYQSDPELLNLFNKLLLLLTHNQS